MELQQNNMKKCVRFLPALVLVIAGCPLVHDNLPRVPEVTSLRNNYQQLIQRAKKWRDDAYLVWARIPIRPEYEGQYLISAYFGSPSDQLQGLITHLETDGSISSQTVEFEPQNLHRDPILFNDWKLDSDAALEIALNDDNFRFISETPNHCSFLTLERYIWNPEKPVVWRLTLTDCWYRDVKQIHVDANSGGILNNQ